ncbi:putative membrane protein, UPF0182 family [Abditibacterium utsteinense]|uniref:Putative membrane protein, UPF0182 family n=1 Tax=Abditibacterium utsteinense TaxID=1960156 RepID=A0A2S8SX44_9BACT|nr:putative membrane protein, UPF0182 family [Abditibacterium utsteinense]
MWSGPILLALLALYKICEWQSERLWFESLGYGAHYAHLFLWRAGTFALGFLVFALWLGINAHIAWRDAASRAVPLSFFQSDDAARLIPLEDKFHLDRYRRRVTVCAVVLLSYLVGLAVSARYLLFVRAFSAAGTGQRDSASNFDLAFFLFGLPFYHFLSRFLLCAIVMALLLVAAIYLYEETLGAPLMPNAVSVAKVRAPQMSPGAARHLAVLWSLLVIWKGLDCLLWVPLSFVSGGNVAARVFDPLDIRLGWTSAAIFALSAPLLALLSGLSIAREPRYRTFVAGIVWMIGASSIPFLLPLVTARNPNDAAWKAALSRHIKSTRSAWGLESTERCGLVVAPNSTFRSAASLGNPSRESAALGASLPLWPALSARNALNARLAARGAEFRVAQVFLERAGNTLRYCGIATLPTPSANAQWRARHERAPFGLWVQMEAARAAPDGSPIFLPDITATASLSAAQVSTSTPRFSPGALQPPEITPPSDNQEWIFTATKNEAAPGQISSEVSDGVESGAHGVSLRAWETRFLVGARFFEPQLSGSALAGDQITWHRAAAQRCRALAPFLDWRDDEARPVLLPVSNRVASGGSAKGGSTKNEAARLVWLVPGLVWSDDYPDSATPAATGTAPPGVNYGGHVAVGVVDASSGNTAFYTLNEDEPFMALYNRAFPGLFAPPTSIPTSIRASLRPSPALLNAQTLIWARYHYESSDQQSLAWAAQSDNYRPLFSAEGALPALRSLASQNAGDWLCMAYARPQGQIGGGAVSPLVSILGADERDFAARGAKVRFVEWKARAPLALPDILVEPTIQLVANRPTLPPPTLLGLAPRFDAKNNAIGLVVSRGEVRSPSPTTGAAPEMRLHIDLQINGATAGAPQIAPGKMRAPSSANPLSLLQNARSAWQDLRAARQKGNWEEVARAESRLDAALSDNQTRAKTPGTNAGATQNR